MNAREYIAYLGSPAGMLKLKDAAKLLANPDPEIDDKDLLAQVVAIGFPKSVALRVFRHCTRRYAPLICRTCSKEFRPRSPFTIDRPRCNPCASGPKTPEKQFKLRANKLAMAAQTNGKIKRHPCEACGRKFDLHMHHPDYSRPLFIQWLCVRCHAAEHKKLRASA